MAALNFPSAPAYGDVYSKWTWDGGRWTCGLLPGPPPTIYAIDPTEAVTGSAAFTLVVVGTNYVADSIIVYDGVDRPTTFQDANLLTATVTPPAQDGTKMVSVRNGAVFSSSVPLVFAGASPPPEITVPEGAAIHIDFVARGASDNGTLVNVNALVGNDPNCPVQTGFADRGYVAEGYSTNAAMRGGLALLGSAKGLLLVGATMVVKFKTTVHLQSMECYLFGEGHTLVASGSPYNGTLILSADDAAYYLLNSEVGQIGGADTYNTMAIISIEGLASTMWGSANGNPQIGSDAIAYPAAWNSNSVAVHSYNNIIQSITIYDSIDPAALPGLSGEAPPVGGSKPDWAPADSTLAIDFIAPGRSWDGTTEGDGSVTGIGSMIGADPLVPNSGYDPAGLSATGYDYRTGGTVPAYIGALKAALLADVTFTVDFMPAPTGDLPPLLLIRSADGLSGLDIKANGSNIMVTTPGGLALTLPGVYYTSMLNRIAVTLTQTRIEVACNGFGEVQGTLIAADRTAPWESLYETGTDLQKIVIYPPLPTMAGLLTLSSTL